MKINWVIKYYFVAFIGIFLLVYYIENSEPFVNWSLYPEISELKIQRLIKEKNCEELEKIFAKEYETNYKTNSLGFMIRKDKLSVRGLNLLKYLKYHLAETICY